MSEDGMDRRLRDIKLHSSQPTTNLQEPLPAFKPILASVDPVGKTSDPTVVDKDVASSRGLVLVKPGLCWDVIEKPAFIFAHPNPTSEHMMKHGIFEQSLITWCKQFLDLKTDILDIGAHSGTYSLSLSPFCRNVYAFEAQRMTYFQLCGGIALNQYHNVFPYHCALGETLSVAELHITSNDGGGSTLDKSIPLKQHQQVLRTETCKVLPLDTFKLFPSDSPSDSKTQEVKIGLIKIDVEGHELAVLRGAKETIKRNGHPPLLFEAWADEWYQPQKQALFDYITQDLKYTSIKPLPHANNMFLAQKK